MGLYLESVFYVELCGLNLIITKGNVEPFDPRTPRGHFQHNAAAFHPQCNMETSVRCSFGFVASFGLIYQTPDL